METAPLMWSSCSYPTSSISSLSTISVTTLRPTSSATSRKAAINSASRFLERRPAAPIYRGRYQKDWTACETDRVFIPGDDGFTENPLPCTYSTEERAGFKPFEMGQGTSAIIAPTVGLLAGFAFLLLIDHITPHIHPGGEAEGPRSRLSRTRPG